MKYTRIFTTCLVLLVIATYFSAVANNLTNLHSAPEVVLIESKDLEEIAPLLSQEDIMCLALNIYHEARGESFQGQTGVTHVVLNRMRAKRFPSTACEVIKQGGEHRRNRCQFSWWCDGRSDMPQDMKAWERSLEIAQLIFKYPDPTDGALWYHADTVRPYWADSLKISKKIGRHLFYVDRKADGAELAQN